jgi:hypothetical protein
MRTLPFVALMLSLAAGCGMSEEASQNGGPIAGNAGSGGSSSPPGERPDTLSFPLPVGTVNLGEQVEVVVQAKPPGVYRVRFSLPSSKGDPRDAFLSTTEADTSANGSVSVLLTAPTSPTTFELRATVDNQVSATLAVTAEEPGTATLIANPVRLGHRNATTWVASVHEKKTCEQVPGIPPADGTLLAFSDRSHAPEIKGVRTGIPLAVVLRSGFFMGGCASVNQLPTDAGDAPHVVDVQVLDRPIDLAASNVTLTLGVAAPEATWNAVLATARTKALEALDGFPDKTRTDVEALLAGMRDDLSGTARDSFSNARSAENWDALLQAHWGSSTKLTELVSGWLSAGQGKLLVSDDVLSGRLVPNVETSKPEDADLVLDTVVGLPAAEAGFVNPADVSWSAGPDDTIVLSTHVYFFSSQLLTRLAEADVLTAYPGANSVGAALATALDCPGLGTQLASAGNDSQLGFAGCDADCLSALCQSALANVWQRARQATAAAPVQIDVAATAEGWVGDSAELAGMKGSWVGQLLSDGAAAVTTGGVLEAALPPLTPR